MLLLSPFAPRTCRGVFLSTDRFRFSWLKLAENAGLGKTEANPNTARDPRVAGVYKVIDYQYQEL